MERIKKFNFQAQKRKIFGLALAAFLLYVAVIIGADIRKILSLWAAFPWRVIPMTIVLVIINYGLRAARFYYLLRKINLRLTPAGAAAIFIAGLPMTVTPGKAGEAVKSYLLKRRTGRGYAQTIPLLVFERVLDGAAMIILSLGGLYLFPSRPVIVFFIFSILLVLGFFLLILSRKPAVFLTRWAKARRHHAVIDFFNHARRLMNIKTVVISLILSLAAWALQGAALYILVKPFIPVSVSLSLGHGLFYALFIFSFSSIAAFLALIPAGLVVAEGALVSFLLFFFHLTLVQAVFVSLIFRLSTLWFGAAVGSVFLAVQLKASRQTQSPKA